MSSESNTNSGKVWGLAIVAGVLAFLALKYLASYAFWPALLLAILIAILVAILLWIGFYSGGEDESLAAPSPAAAPAPAPAASPEPAKAEAAAPAAAVVSTPAAEKPAPAPVEKPAEKPAKKPADKPAAKKAAPKKKAASSAATQKKPATKPAAKPAAKKAASKPARKPVAADGKPEFLSAPREGKPDDLKMIKGIGPKLEKVLNKMGVYHFDQIASWRAREVKWVDENLEGFKGRVSRDEWVKQAKVLAKGGTTEFAKKVKKGGVY